MDHSIKDILDLLQAHISTKQYGIEENDKALEHHLDALVSRMQDLAKDKSGLPFAKEVVDIVFCVAKTHVGLDLKSKAPVKQKRNPSVETLIVEALNICSVSCQNAASHLKTLCYAPKVFALFAASDDPRFQEASGELLWRILRGESESAFVSAFSFAGLERPPLLLTQDHSSSLAKIFCYIKEETLQRDLECFIDTFNESLGTKQKIFSFTLAEMFIIAAAADETKFTAVEVFFSVSRRIYFRVDSGSLYAFDFTRASLMEQNAFEKLGRTREILFSVSSSVALPGLTPRPEEDFYSCGEDVKLRMVFQGSDAEKAAGTLEKILCSTQEDASASMDVEKESPKSSARPSLSVRRSHTSFGLSNSSNNSGGASRLYACASKTDICIKRKTSFVAMTVGSGFPEFDPHPQGGMVSALGEVFVPEVSSAKLWSKRNAKEDPFNDSYPPTGSSSSSSSREKSSSGTESISPIKHRKGEINDKDILSSLSFSSIPQLHKILMKTDSGENNPEEQEPQQHQSQKKLKQKQSRDENFDDSHHKKRSPQKALASRKKKKSLSPSKVLVNSLGAHGQGFRRERKRICDLYAKSKVHFILLEKAMKDTLEQFSEIRLLMAKTAKSIQSIHIACKCQNHF